VAFDLKEKSVTESKVMNLTKVGAYSLIASVVAAIVAIFTLRSRASASEVPERGEYGEWDDTLGI
jgi:uncharacterized membrane protein